MEKEKTEVQYAAVEQPFGCDPPIVYCPICGKATHKPAVEDYNPCKHLVFIYADCIGEFVYQSETFEKRIDEIEFEDFDDEEFKKLFQEVGYGNNLLLLNVTYGGMACGPVWYSDTFAFDYSTIKQEDCSSD